MRPQQYRRVKEEEDEEEEPRQPSCLLPSLLLLFVLISFSLSILVFLRPWKGVGVPIPTSPPTVRTTTATATPTAEEEISWDNTTTVQFNSTIQTNGTDTLETQELKGKLVEMIRKTEKFMERMTGVEGELLVPMLMLLCFLTSVTFVSLCCCIMTKRREARRRHLFGKIITDLQTGDSKTVLLNHSDLDD